MLVSYFKYHLFFLKVGQRHNTPATDLYFVVRDSRNLLDLLYNFRELVTGGPAICSLAWGAIISSNYEA